MAFTGPHEDRTAIRELYGTYADASWRGDRDQWLSCFAPDARWTSHLFDASGHAELGATWDGMWKDWSSVAFLSEVGAIQVNGGEAQCRSYAREIVVLKDGGTFKLVGSYEDQLSKVDGVWRFTRRDYTMIAEA